MRKLLLMSCLISGSFICYSQNAAFNKLTADEMKEGWQLLFDGKTTQGWHTYGKNNVTDSWKVQDGVLFLDTSRKDGQRRAGGDMVTDEEFDNFHLKYEWKIARNGNSGLIFFVKDDPAKYQRTYNTGLEMQVLDNDGHPDGKIKKHRAGDLYDLIVSSSEPVKPVGEWNLAEIISNKGNLELYLNGTKVVTTTLWNDNWKQLVAGSKFKTMPGFSAFKSGKIALQDHGDMVFFRNIKIKRLKS